MALTSSNVYRMEREAGQIGACDRSGWPPHGASAQPGLVGFISPREDLRDVLHPGSSYTGLCISLFLIPKSPSHHPSPSPHPCSSPTWMAGARTNVPPVPLQRGQVALALGHLVCPSQALHTHEENGKPLSRCTHARARACACQEGRSGESRSSRGLFPSWEMHYASGTLGNLRRRLREAGSG